MTQTSGVQPTFASEFKNEWKNFAQLFKRVKRQPSRKKVHDFRVSSRRLEAYLSLIKDFSKGAGSDRKVSGINKKLKMLRTELGEVRNFDADLDLIKTVAIKPPDQVIETLIQKRKKQSKIVSRHFKKVTLKKQSKLIQDLVRSLSKAQLKKSVSAQSILKKSEAEVLSAFRQSMHKARMKAKTLRYQAEILQNLGYSPKVKFDQLIDLQEKVGNLQNTIILLGALEKGSLNNLRCKTIEFQKALKIKQQDLTLSSQIAFQGAPWVN